MEQIQENRVRWLTSYTLAFNHDIGKYTTSSVTESCCQIFPKMNPTMWHT